MAVLPEEVPKLLLAILIGGLIGAEREFRHRAAGFRTIIFICLGATIFTILSLKLGGDMSPVRIAAHVVTGVGFLCAGVVMQEGARVVGLTTASTIWLAAALGIGIGGGQYILCITAAIAALVVLWVFPKLEEQIYSIRDERTYEVVCAINYEKLEQLEAMFWHCDLRVKSHKLTKSSEEMVCIWDVYGAPENHERLVEKLLADTKLKGFRY